VSSLYQDGSGRQCLLIERLTKADAGWYTLSAINEAGMSTCNARLDVSSEWTHACTHMHICTHTHAHMHAHTHTYTHTHTHTHTERAGEERETNSQ